MLVGKPGVRSIHAARARDEEFLVEELGDCPWEGTGVQDS